MPERSTDVKISLEPVEDLRCTKFVKSDGKSILNEYTIPPPNLNITGKEYPPLSGIIENFKKFTTNLVHFNVANLAEKAGAVISLSIVMLDAFTSITNSPLSNEDLLNELQRFIKPKFVDINLAAFESGFQAASKMQ